MTEETKIKAETVVKTADDIIASDAFNDKLADAIGKAIAAAMKPTAETTKASDKLFAAPAHFHRKSEIRNVLGATIKAIYAAHNDLDRAEAIATERWGDGNEVAKVISGTRINKALTSTTTGGAVEMVQESVHDQVIDALRPASIVRASGASLIGNPTGTLQIPRVATGTAGQWVGELAVVNAEQPVFDSVTLTRKKLMIKTAVTKELIMFSTPNTEEVIARDVTRAMVTATDTAYIRGQGTNTPSGVRWQVATSNVFTSTGVAAADVETDIASLLQGVLGNDIPITPETGVFWGNTRVLIFLMKLRDTNGNLIYPELRETIPRIGAYRWMTTNNIGTSIASGGSPATGDTEVYFGHAPSILIADAQDMTMEVLENASYTNTGGTLVSGVDLDTVLIKTMLITDMALQYQTAFAVLDDVQWGA